MDAYTVVYAAVPLYIKGLSTMKYDAAIYVDHASTTKSSFLSSGPSKAVLIAITASLCFKP